MLFAIVLIALFFALPAVSSEMPPDLLMEWVVVGKGQVQAPPIEGESGSTKTVTYRVRNIGGSAAYAVFLRAHTALGPLGPTARLRPGPKAGAEIDRRLRVPLAKGMRELCVEARLQILESADPVDPNPRNNRVCRTIRVVESASSTE